MKPQSLEEIKKAELLKWLIDIQGSGVPSEGSVGQLILLGHLEKLEQMLQQVAEEARRETASEIVNKSDEIEGQNEAGTQQWMGFKALRNWARDHYNLLTTNETTQPSE